MSITRDEAYNLMNDELSKWIKWGPEPNSLHGKMMQAVQMSLNALRTPTREQVEKVRGEWIDEDPPVEYYICSKCGECAVATADHGYQYRSKFCPHCGAPMTDKAVDMMLERWKETLHDAKN